MIRLLSDYYRQKNSHQPICLGMTLMVRDEEDIIEKNIRFHHAMGVEKFFIANNASVDRTRDIIEVLKDEFDIKLINNSDKTGHLQEKTVTMLVRMAKASGCDWVINNDADEFWVPDNKMSYLPYLTRQDAVLQINRFNMQVYDNISSCFHSEYLCYHPIDYDFSCTDFIQNYINVNLAPCLYKVMTNVHGLAKIRGGNHAAKHVADWLKRKRFTRKCYDITVYHYPIRTLTQFRKRLGIIKKIGDAGKLSQMGGSARYWYSAVCHNRIDEAYEAMILNHEAIKVLQEQRVIQFEIIPSQLFHQLNLIE